MAADLENQLALLGLRLGAASLEAMGNTWAHAPRAEKGPFALPSGLQIPIVNDFTVLCVFVSLPAAVDRAEAHRRQCAYAAFWRDAHLICDARRPLAARLCRFHVNAIAVYFLGAGGLVLGEALKANVMRFESRCLRNIAGIRRHATEAHREFKARVCSSALY
jgi:hypothetical protein